MTTKDFLITLGLNDQTTKTQLVTTQDAIFDTQDIVGDCTIQEAFGCYTHEDGTRVREVSLKIEVYGVTYELAKQYVEKLKAHFNQECVVLKAEGEPAQFL